MSKSIETTMQGAIMAPSISEVWALATERIATTLEKQSRTRRSRRGETGDEAACRRAARAKACAACESYCARCSQQWYESGGRA